MRGSGGSPQRTALAGRTRGRARSAADATPLARATVVVDGPPPGPGVARASVVVPTHNDGGNIGALLGRLLAETEVGEIVVVASGCDDLTVPTVCTLARGAGGRVRLYVELERSGKTAAVNFGTGRCSLPVVVIVSGDVLPAPGAVGDLVAAVGSPGVGMAGGRPVPVNSPATPLGAVVHVLWALHHRMALRQPKLGELVAIRREALCALPPTSVDEACFQARVEAAGWRSVYVPGAVVANRGPGTVRDFVKQRRQVHTGHLWLRRREGYTVPSLRPLAIVRDHWAEMRAGARSRRPRRWWAPTVAGVLELWSRALARIDYLRGRETHVWDMVASAKDPALGPDRGDAGRR